MKVYLVYKVENIGTRGEIANHRQIFLLPQYFQKSSAEDKSASGKRLICWVKGEIGI